MKQMVKNWKIIESLRDYIFGNKDKKAVEVGVDLEVDGKIKVNSVEDITDKDGNPLEFGTEIVDSEEIVTNDTEEGTQLLLAQTVSNKINNSLQLPQQAPTEKKVVVIDTNGAQTLEDFPSGTKIYRHKFYVGLDWFVVFSNISSNYTSLNSVNSSAPSNNILSIRYGSGVGEPTKFYDVLYTQYAYSTGLTICYFDSTGEFKTKSINGAINQDTVTEL